MNNKCTDMVKLFLTYGASSRRNDEHYTALDYAAGRDNVDVIRILLDHEDAAGLTLNAPDNNAALQEVASRGHEDIVRLLSMAALM